jgi:hypothetical protein
VNIDRWPVDIDYVCVEIVTCAVGALFSYLLLLMMGANVLYTNNAYLCLPRCGLALAISLASNLWPLIHLSVVFWWFLTIGTGAVLATRQSG